MSKKKDIVRDALLIARDLEIAAKKNAQDIVVEAFAPRLMDVVRQTIREEGPGPQLDDPVTKLASSEEEETESSEVQNDAQVSDGHPEGISPTQGDHELSGKGKKHDLDRTAPAPGQMTENEDGDEDDYMGDEDPMEEGEDHDLGKLHFDDRDAGDSEFASVHESDDMDDDDIDLDVDPSAGDDEELDIDVGMDEDDDMDLDDMDGEDELDLENDDMDMDDMDMDDVDPEDDVFEAEDEEGGEDLEIPDELFDDADDQDVGGDEDVPVDEDDEELDLDVVDDEDPDMSGDEDMMGDEEFEEGLYVRKEGKFEKVDPSQALEARMNDLEEERNKLANALTAMKGQLGEQHLLNVKLVHLVRLYESGQFSSKEKRRIAERLDRCGSPKKVQAVYKSIVAEASDRTVLDDVHDVLTEQRVRRTSRPTGEAVYESEEVKRMRRLAGLED